MRKHLVTAAVALASVLQASEAPPSSLGHEVNGLAVPAGGGGLFDRRAASRSQA